MYSIKRQGSKWIVFMGWEIVYYAMSKMECVEWIAEQKVAA